jgi:hypothetical protein
LRQDKLVAYVGPAALHDATVRSVVQDGDKATIVAVSIDRQPITLEFFGVFELTYSNAVGMMLYALVEMTGVEPLHRYVFASWDPEYVGTLEVIAEGFRVVT